MIKKVAYDIKIKEKKVIKENALDFELSPNKNQFAIVTEDEKNKHSLILTDLEGHNEVVIVDEGSDEWIESAYIITFK